MASSLRNPYQRKSKFQYSHPLSSSLSTSSLFAPTVSTCPRKKYSTETWYDFKSSNPQLSDKVLYRMQANFYALQSKGPQEQQYQHIQNCLLNSECKKNPFHKSSLIDLHAINNNHSFNKDSDLHWTDERFKKNLWPQQSHQSSLETLNQYSELRKKELALKDKLHYSHNNSTFNLKGTGNFGMESEPKITSQRQEKHLNSVLDKQLTNKNLYSAPKVVQKQLKQSQRKYEKQQSGKTFGYRRSSQQIPQKITYMEKPFFFVRLGIEEK